MIVPSMTLTEVHKELTGDLRTLEKKIDDCRRLFKKRVLKANKFPLFQTFECLTVIKKNTFLVNLYATKRGDFENPLMGIIGVYKRPEGAYAAALTLQMDTTTIYPPHFFSRYRERILKKQNLSSQDLIKEYFLRNGWGFVGAPADPKFQDIYDLFEPNITDENISFVCVSSEGFSFGERQKNINIIKTIISEDMLHDDQKDVFRKLKEDFQVYGKSMFGSRFSS